MFLASDIASFEQYKDQFDNALSTGKLGFAFDIFNLSLKRRFERYDYSLSLLENEMKFDKEDEYLFDREDANWATSQADLDELWRQRVKYDALRLKMTGKDWQGIKEVLTKRYHNAQKRLYKRTVKMLFKS